MPYQPMITETGEIDHLAIAERAPLRAAHEFGGPNFPPSYLRDATRWLEERAVSERLQWRRHHNLPDDSVMVPMGAGLQRSLETYGAD